MTAAPTTLPLAADDPRGGHCYEHWVREFLDVRRADCMSVMARFPDGHFDLAIVDPPYGIGEHGGKSRHKPNAQKFTVFQAKHWDNNPPGREYFDELRRVSKNQIVWGANYFSEHLPRSMGWVFWDKLMGGDFSDGELAYTSFQRALKKFVHPTFHNRVTNREGAQGQCRIHPCQKPVQLYQWLLDRFAKPGQRILDTHMGSGSIAIACHFARCPLVACEIDPDYFRAACERIETATRQGTLELPNNELTESLPRAAADLGADKNRGGDSVL